jgi:CRISPR-associated endonuclease/helicase Cas3
VEYYAHSKDGAHPKDWHPLEDHLRSVAEKARQFAEPFGGGEWASLAGLWHDVGKYSDEFQKKLYDAHGIECHLETKSGNVIHSQAGGHLAQQTMRGGMDRIFSWLIMGHHAGLADFSSAETGAKALEPKLRQPETSESILTNVPGEMKDQPEPFPPEMLLKEPRADISFFIRMLFSCVVDADFLDTEEFMDSGRNKLRQTEYPSVIDLLAIFDRHMDEMCRNADETDVNHLRYRVLARCREMAKNEPAVFSLTVPTGGGKTFSSLAFALRHAVKHEKRRIIYVIPYTSIIEQTADVFRSIPGFENAVLEHHSNVLHDDEARETVKRRLAAENWDAPIIVTTSVQFFESLYACKTSRCRKLHNIANSVVIFDEAQCLPPQYLRPAVFAIRELNRHYGVTPVLCTATQPVLTKTERFDFNFREGFEDVTEIMERPDRLTEDLQRVRVERYSNLDPIAYEQIAESMQDEGQSVLCIVNRKQDARTLSRILPEEQTVHLSTNMCAEHRFQTLEDVRQRLPDRGNPLFVVSTSLVEAGVDLDFPVVYRALAGLDSIAQAAGRCNREGKLPNLGRTVVFVPPDQPAYVLAPASLALEHLRDDRLSRIFHPQTFSRYFDQRFFQLGEKSLDEKNIMGLLSKHLEYSFRTAADRFRLIDDSWQLPLIVPFGEAPAVVDKLIEWDARRLFRKLQRYTISIPKKAIWRMLDEGHVRELSEYPGTYYLLNMGLYNDRFGFIPPDEIDVYEPGTTII